MDIRKFVHDESVYNVESANEIVPIIYNLIKPESVIDIGCGLGTFLRVFKDMGVKKVLGIDGTWVEISKLKKNIKNDEFIPLNIEDGIYVGEQYDLAICLEVAEHLSESVADNFIQHLTELSSVILFSAAIPSQGGYGHLNEKWPSYWMSKFESRDYQILDIIRPLIWDNPKIFWWYKQNMFLFIKKSKCELIKEIKEKTVCPILNLVHPELYLRKCNILEKIQYGESSITEYLKLFVKGILQKMNLYKRPKVIY